MNRKQALTYREAGVSVEAGDAFVRGIADSVRSTRSAHPGKVLDDLTNFAGLFRLGGGFRDPVLVSATDGVGTKLMVAQILGRHGTVGVDLVAMCVNDVLTSGAQPLFFLDYLASGSLEPDMLAPVVEGIAEGCRQAGCVLLGGETAEMPDFYRPGVYDLAGFAVGAVERDELLDGSAVAEGDVLLGLPSSGLHSNGYSLARRIFGDPQEWTADTPEAGLGRPLGEVLLEPTRIYAAAVRALTAQPGVHAMAHITGGGLPANLARILPPALQARLRPESWPTPPIFDLMARRGPVEPAEMHRTFNMGLGFVAALDPAAAEGAEQALAAAGETVHRVGEVAARPAGEAAVRIGEIEDGG